MCLSPFRDAIGGASIHKFSKSGATARMSIIDDRSENARMFFGHFLEVTYAETQRNKPRPLLSL